MLYNGDILPLTPIKYYNSNILTVCIHIIPLQISFNKRSTSTISLETKLKREIKITKAASNNPFARSISVLSY